MIALKVFTGEFPRQQAQLLPDNAAANAVDCDFTRGNLIGIRARSAVPGFNAPAGIKSMFVYDGVASSMFAWTRDVDAVRGPVPNDEYSRFYWTDGSGFFVSRGDVGGNGQEPSSTNKYKVGCPTPSAAMTIAVNDSKLALPGVLSTAFSVFCEGTDGSAASETALPGPTMETMNAWTTDVWDATWSTGLSCSTTSSGGTAGTGVQGLTACGVADGFIVLRNDLDSYFNSALYFHHDDYLNVPLGSTYRTKSDFTLDQAPGFSIGAYHGPTWYNISGGWYSTKQGDVLPAGASDETTSAAAVPRTMAMKLTFTVDVGTPITAIIRTNGQNTIPDAFSKFSFTLTQTSGGVSLRIEAKTGYKEFRAYSYSYVNQYGEESGLAAPVTIDLVEGQPVTLRYTNLPDSAGYCPVSLIRIYRTANGSGSTDYSFVDEILHNDTDPTYTDTKRGDELGAPSQAAGFEAPPQNLRGLCQMSNGILAAFSGSDLYFMEPYLPYAYRPSTIKPLPHAIVGICPTDDGLYVTTRANPYLITGVSPDTMTDRKVPAVQAGVSKGSMCSIGATVAYASHDGIVLLRGIDASLDMSFQFFTRDSWRERYGNKLSLMRMNAHDGNVVVWFEDGTPGFLIRTEEGSPSMTKVLDPIYAAFNYPIGDALYVAQGSTVFEFKGGATHKAFDWTSKDFILPKPVNFGCIQFVGNGHITFIVSADGVVRHTQTVTLTGADTDLYRLPSGFLCRRWSVQIIGSATTEVTELYFATSPSELQNV